MIFKVFYQKDERRAPRRETTQIMYLDLDVQDENAGVIAGRELLAQNTAYVVEFIQALSDDAVAYDQENGDFQITTF
mgnify:CR=1 FL=1